MGNQLAFSKTHLNDLILAGKTDKVLELIDYGCPVDVNTFSCAIQTRCIEIQMKLTESGYDLNDQDWSGNTPLMLAARDGQAKLALKLLKEGCHLYLRNRNGETAMTLALENSFKTAMQLIDAGCCLSPREKNIALVCALHQSCVSVNVIMKLIKMKCNINAGKTTYTPLLLAVKDSRVKIAMTLIEAGCDVNLQSRNGVGHTALMWAVENNLSKIANALLEAGCDANIKTFHGRSAFEMAYLLNHHGIARVLAPLENKNIVNKYAPKLTLEFEKIQELLDAHSPFTQCTDAEIFGFLFHKSNSTIMV